MRIKGLRISSIEDVYGDRVGENKIRLTFIDNFDHIGELLLSDEFRGEATDAFENKKKLKVVIREDG